MTNHVFPAYSASTSTSTFASNFASTFASTLASASTWMIATALGLAVGGQVTLAQSDDTWEDPAARGSRVSTFYLRNSVGANILNSVSLNDVTAGSDDARDVKIKFDTGFAWGIDLGWRLSDLLSVEASSGLMYNSLSSGSGTLTVNGDTASGSLEIGGDLLQVPLMAGVAFDIPLSFSSAEVPGSGLYLRLGASAGGLFVRGTLNDLGDISGGSDQDFTWCYALTAALDWEFADQLLLGLSYRYLGTGSVSFDAFGVPGLFDTSGYGNQQIMASLSYNF